MDIFSKLLASLEIAPKRILDVGAGDGKTTALVQRMFPNSKIISLDFREEMCRYVKEHFNEHVICADATRIPFRNNSFDLVVSDQTIEHIENQNTFVEELYRVLTVEGYIICGSVLRKRFALAFRRNDAGDLVLASDHVREYRSEQEFADVFNKNFNILRISTPFCRILPQLPFILLLGRMGLFNNLSTIIQRYDPDLMSTSSPLRKLFIRMPRPGYRWIYLIGMKKGLK